MAKKCILKIAAFAVYFLTLAAIVSANQGDKDFELATRNYKNAHYRKALYYFKKAQGSKLGEEKVKFIKYAIRVMEESKSYLAEIEKEEVSLKTKSYDRKVAGSLAERHYIFAKNLLGKRFYLLMVEPHLKRTVALDPYNIPAYLDLGDAYYYAMRYEKAIECYEKVMAFTPSNLYARKMAGDACVAIGDYDKAKKHYSDLIIANETSAPRYEPQEIEKIKNIIKVLPETYKDVDALLKEKRMDEAEAILKKRLSLNPSDYIAMTALGDIYEDRGDRNEALRLFKRAIKIAPDYPLSHLYIGRLYFLTRDHDNAISELGLFKEKMRKLPKMDSETKKMYIDSLYYLSGVYFTLKRYEDMRAQAEEILKLDPKQQGAYYDLGIYYYVYEHSRSKAYGAFKKVIEMDPTTNVAKDSKYAIEFMRNNPDPRVVPDFSFIDREYRD